MAVATKEEIAKALALWSVAQQGKTPQEWQGFAAKYNLQNPFDPWPPESETIKKFIQKFQDVIIQNPEAQIYITHNISAKKLEGLVDDFDREYGKIKLSDAAAEKRSKDHLKELLRRTIEMPAPAYQKEAAFNYMVTQSLENPSTPADQIEKDTAVFIEKAQPFLQKSEVQPEVEAEQVAQRASFGSLQGKNIGQRMLAPFADAVVTVFPDLRQGVFNKNIEAALKEVLNYPSGALENFMTRIGISTAESLAFKTMLAQASSGMSQGSTGGAAGFFDGLMSNIFHSAYITTAEDSVKTYFILLQNNVATGTPTTSANAFMAAGMRLGANYMFSQAKGAALKSGVFKAGLAKLGLEAAIPGGGWLAAALTLGGGLFGKFANWLTGKKPVPGEVPGDRAILGVGCLVLFLLMGLPLISQTVIDSSLSTRLAMGGGPPAENQYLDVSIAATPETQNDNTITSMRYTITVKPKGSPFTINNVNVQFSVFGGSGNPTLGAPTITPDMLSGGSYSFVVPFGTNLNNSVVTASVNVSANVGSASGVTGSGSVSTVIGNPATACFVFGGAGVADAYGHTSGSWDSTGAVTAAIGILEKAPEYISKICSGGQPITIYRVFADFGGGSTSPPNSIFMYNACATTGCATYTLAHETGHILDSRTDLFNDEYNALALYTREGPLWTYPNGFSEHEDFAETMGAYVVWGNYMWGARHGHAGGNLNYPGTYPLHYQFAKGVFGCVEFNGSTNIPCGFNSQ